MFAEFFLRSGPWTAVVAWGGLIVVFGYSMFLAWVKAELNDFYTDFYDLMQQAGTLANADGSGEQPSLAAYRQQVSEQLLRFARIVAPLVTASPAAKWARSAWAFAWRAALMRSYLKAWDISKEPIEGASQRLHEDTQRFCNALQGCLATMLDAVFTLGVFTPILMELSTEVAPPFAMGKLRGLWLWMLAFFAALVGLGGAMLFGQKLVQLEVNNQKVEAAFRKDLVLLETTPAVIVGIPMRQQDDDDYEVCPGTQVQVQATYYAPWLYFGLTLKSLRKNYNALFRHFSLLNFWLTLFDQTMVILPYVVAAPLLFADDPATRITLGTLVKMSNSFDKVFSSLSIIAENWGEVNAFRSVYRRLREFEAKLYLHRPPKRSNNCLLPVPETNGGGGNSGGGGGGGGGGGASNGGRRRRRDCQRSESLSHTRNEGSRSSPSATHTELVVVEGGPVAVHATYGEDAFPDSLDTRHDMRV